MRYFSTLFIYNGKRGVHEWYVEEDSSSYKFFAKGENPPGAEKFILSKLGCSEDEVRFFGVKPFRSLREMEDYTNKL
jgi:hypothetical protein